MRKTRLDAGALYHDALTALRYALQESSSPEKFPEFLIRSIVKHYRPADAGILYLHHNKEQKIIAKASHGYPNHHTEHRLRPDESIVGYTFTQCQPLLLTSPADEDRINTALESKKTNCYAKIREGLPPIRSVMTVPIIVNGSNAGVILLEHYQRHRPFQKEDVAVLQELTYLISQEFKYVQFQQELKQTKRSYRDLLGKWIATTEKERQIIARDIHDQINQLLLSVRLNLESMEGAFPATYTQVRNNLELSKVRINQAFDELHKLVFKLRPPVLDLGLAQALEWYINNFANESEPSITLKVHGLRQWRPAPVVETNLFRIAQEALTNVVKHAQAKSARVLLNSTASRLTLVVEDEGIGFDYNMLSKATSESKILGILGMMERAHLCGGHFHIDSTPGKGTRITVDVPVSSYDWGAY